MYVKCTHLSAVLGENEQSTKWSVSTVISRSLERESKSHVVDSGVVTGHRFLKDSCGPAFLLSEEMGSAKESQYYGKGVSSLNTLATGKGVPTTAPAGDLPWGLPWDPK